MDGDLDEKLRDFFGMDYEKRVKAKIKELYFGEIPVGCAISTEVKDKNFKYIISAPTMLCTRKDLLFTECISRNESNFNGRVEE